MKPEFSFFEGRPLVGITLLYGAGLFIGSKAGFHWLWFLGLAVGLILLVLCVLLKKKKHTAIGILAVFTGILFAAYQFFPQLPDEGKYQVEGRMSGALQEKKETPGEYVGLLTNIKLDGKAVEGKAYWTFTAYDASVPDAWDGDVITFEGSLYHPKRQENPGGFDFSIFLSRQGISFGLYGSKNLTVQKGAEISFSNRLYQLQNKLNGQIAVLMGETAPLAQAMVLGERGELEDRIQEDFSSIGIAHILSISGLHMTIIAAIVLTFLKKLPIGPKWKWWIMAALLGGYCLLVGGGAAVMRAVILFLVFSGARSIGRAYDDMTALALSALIILLIEPSELLSPGFQLSFGAVAGMMLLSSTLERGWTAVKTKVKGKKAAAGKIGKMICVSMAAQLGIFLPMAYWFHKVPVLGLFVNLVAIPYVSGVLIPVYFALLIFSFVPGINVILGGLADILTRILLFGSRVLAQIPGMEIGVKTPNLGVAFAFIAIILLVSPYQKIEKKKKRMLLAGLSIVGITASLLMGHSNQVHYIQLSVGQADAAVVEDGKYTVVIDTGENGKTLANYLLGKGRQIDALFITHLHMDHVGGIDELLEQGVVIKEVFLPYGAKDALIDDRAPEQLKLLEDSGVEMTYITAGDEFVFSKAAMKVLWPDKSKMRKEQDANNYSLVMEMKVGNNRLLTTGDLTGLYENYSMQDVDILKVAHHGSAYSTFSEYLAQLSPQVAIISSGTSDRLPSPKTIQRINQQEIPYYQTNVSGSIEILFTQDEYRVYPYQWKE